jgi:hypothetical protein
MPNHDTYNDIKSCEKVSDIRLVLVKILVAAEPDRRDALQIEYAVDPVRRPITIRI